MKEIPVGKDMRDAIQLHTQMLNQYLFVANSISACRDSLQNLARSQVTLDEGYDWKFDLQKMAFVGVEKKNENSKVDEKTAV